MKYYILAVITMFVLNIFFTGMMQDHIRRDGLKIVNMESELAAGRTRNSFLNRERQDLLRRDRITAYAKQHLGMISLTPDQIATSGQIREIQEITQRNRNIAFVIVDFQAPKIVTLDTRR